jgi:hypothetical protein
MIGGVFNIFYKMLKTHHPKKKKTHPINRHNNGYQNGKEKSCIHDWGVKAQIITALLNAKGY